MLFVNRKAWNDRGMRFGRFGVVLLYPSGQPSSSKLCRSLRASAETRGAPRIMLLQIPASNIHSGSIVVQSRHVLWSCQHAARCTARAVHARRKGASDSGLQFLARYGQNEPSMVVGRRNWLFYGSDKSVRTGASRIIEDRGAFPTPMAGTRPANPSSAVES
jgi:hypothetical protein